MRQRRLADSSRPRPRAGLSSGGWTTLTRRRAAIAGIAGNVQQESSFNPRAVEKAEQGYTWRRWTESPDPTCQRRWYGLQDSSTGLWADDASGSSWALPTESLTCTRWRWPEHLTPCGKLRNRPRFAGPGTSRRTDRRLPGRTLSSEVRGFNPHPEGLRNQCRESRCGAAHGRGRVRPLLDHSATISTTPADAVNRPTHGETPWQQSRVRAVGRPATGHYLDDGRLPVHVIHGTDGAGDPDCRRLRGAPRQPTGFNKVIAGRRLSAASAGRPGGNRSSTMGRMLYDRYARPAAAPRPHRMGRSFRRLSG